MTLLPDFSLENELSPYIVAGVDEAGRGPWAGPVIAAAVIINQNKLLPGLNDSKKISKKKRELLFNLIINDHEFGIGSASVEEIDELNILNATMLAMQRAINNISKKIDIALIDGNKAPDLYCKSQAVIKGDSKSISIAAASIMAKVTRDKIMEGIGLTYPQYNWHSNAGYGTREHINAIEKYGVNEHHRKSFAPIRKIMEKEYANI